MKQVLVVIYVLKVERNCCVNAALEKNMEVILTHFEVSN